MYLNRRVFVMFRSPLTSLHCFITVFVILCGSLCRFTDEVGDSLADRT